MKKIMLKTPLIILALFIFIVLTSCKAISKDEANTNLLNAGYKVEIMDGDEFEESDENKFLIFGFELEYYLYAEKDEDEIHMFFFISIDAASENEPFIYYDGLKGGQINNLVYYGTKQAIKDAQI